MNYEIGCHIEKKMTGDIESEGYAVLENLKEIALFNTLRFLKWWSDKLINSLAPSIHFNIKCSALWSEWSKFFLAIFHLNLTQKNRNISFVYLK